MKKISVKDKNAKNRVSFIIGGSGGQGVLTMGKIIASAAIKQKLEVSCLPSYGAEMRGGYVYCTIVISSSKGIFSPISSELDIGIFMNEKSCKMLISYLKKNAHILINSSLIKNFQNKNFTSYKIPATEIAEQLGDIKNANMILAGAVGNIINRHFLKFNISSLYAGVAAIMSDRKMSEKSKKVIKAGWELIGNGRCPEKC
ncbi:MAG TPA: 2-oxoacid:acceptor oxidoreductase family protein [bacterium]|nr:2-oxoacid:acceptor oxidoreductase family protein [bacterium]